jgi:hypothetical protein
MMRGKEMRMLRALGLAGAVVACALLGCDEKAPATSGGATGDGGTKGTEAVERGAGGAAESESRQLKFENVQVMVPEGWRRIPVEGISRRVAYEVPGGAEVEFMAAMDTVLANRDRLAKQYSGGPEPEFEVREIDGVEVTIVRASGTYQQFNQPPRENWGLRAAIADTPMGLVFMELRGPAEAVDSAAGDFEEMVGSLRVEK